jgi:hypothetical protein
MSDKFTVIFYDEDKKNILDKQEVKKGTQVKYNGKIPEKPAVNGIDYTFVGWETTGNITCVMEDINLYARYEESSKANAKNIDAMYELSENNAEIARLNEVMEAGKKVNEAEKATRDMTIEQKQDLVNEIKDKGSVDLSRENENERE